MKNQQKTIKDLINLVSKSSNNLNIVCFILGIVGLLLPFIYMRINVGMGVTQTQSFNGFSASGWMAWITIFSFVVLIASNYVEVITPYKNLIRNVVLLLIAITIIYAWFYNPVRVEVDNSQQQLNQLQQGFQQSFRYRSSVTPPRLSDALHTFPHIGMILFFISGIGLIFSTKKRT
ncbi:unnamed protein product [Commensalibacter communis]|uniref:hypothetical protein n=1 Tax=Commensalibacter communis TaxID=2972786 RepID=UPI0022FF9403|nr:hypothetical protein [Commensalibacter communis]CAI3947695.1 unnamed protein product [Commensalibacter communis]